MYNLILTESEKNRILGLHKNDFIFDSIVITDWLSPDEKYCIFLDELYDIEKKHKIGNVFENFDHFIFFLKHCYTTANHLTEELRSDLIKSVDSLIITESNQNINGLKPYIKQIIQEWTANIFNKDFYSGENWKDAYESGKNTVQSGWEGLKKAYSNIKDGDWKQAFTIIGKGALYVARKIRSAMFTTIGLVFDAILVATGIGKSFQFVIWAIIVLLDVYELSTGDYEDKDRHIIWRFIFLGIDIIGMVSAGAAAKAANVGVGKLMNTYGKTAEGAKQAIKASPFMKSTAENILKASSNASGFMQKALSYLQKNSPLMYNFFGKMFSAFIKFLNMMVKALIGLLGGAGKVLSAPGKAVQKIASASMKGTKNLAAASASANVLVPAAAFHAYGEYKQDKELAKVTQAIRDSPNKPNYDAIEW